MSSGGRWVWVVYWAVVVAGALALIVTTRGVLVLEHRELSARAETEFQSRVQRALWRMDSFVAPVRRAEDARPYFDYQPFYPAERAYSLMYQPVEAGELVVASSVLRGPGEFVLLHFQTGIEGGLSSPQVPTKKNEIDLHESQLDDPSQWLVYAHRLDELRSRLGALVSESARASRADSRARRAQMEQMRLDDAAPAEDYQAREQLAQRESNAAIEPAPALDIGAALPIDADREPEIVASSVRTGPMTPVWQAGPGGQGDLFLIRFVNFGPQGAIQGAWLDWPALRDRLTELARPLLPEATLRIVTNEQPSREDPFRLASLPVALDPGPVPEPRSAGLSSTRMLLLVAWGTALIAALGVGGALRSVTDLSERRGRFVSAVTHELRTPLTTFRLYTDMLAGGMIRDDETRREYLTTLKGESERLSGIVETVLSYARLSRRDGRSPKRSFGRVALGELIDSILPVLEERSGACGLSLRLDSSAGAECPVLVDRSMVERILVNLVDNACKYAADAGPAELVLGVRDAGQMVELSLRDFGPGVPAGERKKVFEPFHRIERDTDGRRAGLGLGLPLARGLARQMGGDLNVDSPATGPGAVFTLALPKAPPRA